MKVVDNVNKSLQCKVVVLGDSGVGKTASINRFVYQKTSTNLKETIGTNCFTKTIKYNDGNVIDFIIWDTAGQERFHSVTSIFYRGTNACILVFDITNRKSFERLEFWREQMINNTESGLVDYLSFIIFANKSDLEKERTVSNEEIQEYAKLHNLQYFDVSAFTGENIEKGFIELGKLFIDSLEKLEIVNQTLSLKQTTENIENEKTSCC